MTETVEKRDKFGALWKRKSKDGDVYLSGELEIPDGVTGKVKVVVFKTREKAHDRMPDYIILKSRDTAAPTPQKKYVKPATKPVAKKVEPVEEETEI